MEGTLRRARPSVAHPSLRSGHHGRTAHGHASGQIGAPQPAVRLMEYAPAPPEQLKLKADQKAATSPALPSSMTFAITRTGRCFLQNRDVRSTRSVRIRTQKGPPNAWASKPGTPASSWADPRASGAVNATGFSPKLRVPPSQCLSRTGFR